MTRKKKKKVKKRGYIFAFLLVMFAIYKSGGGLSNNFSSLKNIISNENYQGKAYLVVDRSTGEVVSKKSIDYQVLPASLVKLYTLDYALSLVSGEELVEVSQETLDLVDRSSSTANLTPGNYYFYNLVAALLLPSGSDAAYAIADYCGGLLNPNLNSSFDRVNYFINQEKVYLDQMGIRDTVISNPSGYDFEALTTCRDLKTVMDDLLGYDWLRDIVNKRDYITTRPDGMQVALKNTNLFLDWEGKFYNENVKGFKTGSLGEDFNLVVLYEKDGKEYLIISLGSKNDDARYEDVTSLMERL